MCNDMTECNKHSIHDLREAHNTEAINSFIVAFAQVNVRTDGLANELIGLAKHDLHQPACRHAKVLSTHS